MWLCVVLLRCWFDFWITFVTCLCVYFELSLPVEIALDIAI